MSKNLQNNFINASLKRGVSALAIAVATFCGSSVFAQDATYIGVFSPSVANPVVNSNMPIDNTVPAGMNSVTIQMWGAGGNGAGRAY